MNRWLSATTCLTMIACGGSRTAPVSGEPSGPTSSRDVASTVEGTYDFVATVPGQAIRGTLQVAADTMFFAPAEGCDSNIRSEPIGHASNGGVLRYACMSAVLAFDRRNPVRSSKWSATVRQQRRREVCAERAVRNGREVCIRNAIETYEVSESRTGSIQVTRRP
jgi:hypothetical protein